MGISTAVSLKWLVLLIGSVTLVSVFLYALQKITSMLSLNPFFISSFFEGNQMSLLNVTASNEILELDLNHLLSSNTIGDGKISYVLTSPGFGALKTLEAVLLTNEMVEAIQPNR